jgi:hypothetical protein
VPSTSGGRSPFVLVLEPDADERHSYAVSPAFLAVKGAIGA